MNTHGPFSWLVRESQERPPLSILFGWPYFCISQAILLINLFYCVPFGRTLGNFFETILLTICGVILDALSSNSFSYNIQTLRLNGFSDWYVFGSMIINWVNGQTASVVVFRYIAGPDEIVKLFDISSYTIMTIAQVFMNLTCTEILFYFAHRYLHENWPSLHLMHHCCLRTTGSSNLIFHPLDLMIEFGGPGMILFFNHYIFWNQNVITLLVSYLYVQIHYTLNHNEWISTYHKSHHSQLDAAYAVYLKIRGQPEKDKLRKLIKRPAKSE
ncbi:hypothetical protein THRCLA_22342 [Thraustotheca clavata]|uniref:Fatty acid hydroxylase domain-containing protein n=1 Tax=Thraustotheca clavata TaxID=74557 RepID=A0A1V9Z5E2_9STRA|nr:hypothetical protein THRCLA_22342 [Thraustotheca clavata]